jgi:hypothetical protein
LAGISAITKDGFPGEPDCLAGAGDSRQVNEIHCLAKGGDSKTPFEVIKLFNAQSPPANGLFYILA